MNDSKKTNDKVRKKVGTIVDEDGVILGGIYEPPYLTFTL